MDNIKKIILLLGVILLCGCSKVDGTWCSYTETFSSLVITSDDITQEQLNNVVKTISKLENLKSYDVVEYLDNGNPVINIYFLNKEGMNNSESLLNNLKGVSRVEKKSFEVPSTSLVIKNSKYTYGTNLDNVDAISKDGSLEFKDDKVYLKDNDVTYYYKDKMLCTDLECSSVLIKSKKKTC